MKSVIHICLGIVILGLMSAFFPQTGQAADYQHIVGPKKCQKCHKEEYKAWKGSTHAKNKDLHKSKGDYEDAKKIAEALGIKKIRGKDSLCLGCHYTVKADKKGRPRPSGGNSCEACHGPAKAWLYVHSCYGGKTAKECQDLKKNDKDLKKTEEDPAHKQWRLAERIQLGMLPPQDLPAVAQNCFQCHTVPNEKLVNQGGHPAGSEFELVSWSQGEVRHNFMRAEAGKTANISATPKQKQLMYVVGRALDLEFSLRALAKASEEGDYSKAMRKRVEEAGKRLNEIQAKVKLAEISSMMKAIKGLKLDPNNEQPLLRAAQTIATATKTFFARAKGGTLSLKAVNGLIPTKVKGKAFQ